MEKRRLGKKIELPGLTLIPVEQISIAGDHNKFGLSMFAECRPLGLIIESADQRWAIDIKGEPVREKELLVVET
ncbi:MAG: hypothetical protein OEX19_17100 [Gammaproteobacteria bacterium]|nr:hypothetical protein [Gammaproteobacteria bacterium]